MASQFPPEALRLFEAQHAPQIPVVPFVRVNGLLRYKLLPGGWAWSRYFALDEPCVETPIPESAKRPCLELLCHLSEQIEMRGFVERSVADSEPWH